MKSIGLKALKYLEDWHGDQFDLDADLYDSAADLIRKELESLNIIIEKRVNVNVLSNCYSPCEYNEAMNSIYDKIAENYYLTYQEFKLLKEVFEAENN